MTRTANATRILALLAAASGLTACGYVDRYEAAVYDLDPRYCYRTLAGVECHDQPYQPVDEVCTGRMRGGLIL